MDAEFKETHHEDLVQGYLVHDGNESYKKYANIAFHLKEHPSVLEIVKVLLDITSGSRQSEPPFVFLEGSSGKGKTQMAFNLQFAINNRLLFYTLTKKQATKAQAIYRNFNSRSELFEQCLLKDNSNFVGEASSPSCSTLFRERLYVFGFVYAVIQSHSTEEKVKISPKSGPEIVSLMSQLGILERRPIFIVDECVFKSNTDEESEFRFIRNVFRCLGIGLVLLGTNSKAARLPLDIGTSSRIGDPQKWCYIFGNFPSVNLELLDAPSNIPDLFQKIILYSRPLFAQMAVSLLSDSPNINLDHLASTVFKNGAAAKQIFSRNNYYGRVGQIRLFLNASFQYVNDEHGSTPLIDSHFATLYGAKNLVLMNTGCLENSDNDWHPTSIFPSLDEDILLYLCFMRGKEIDAFREESFIDEGSALLKIFKPVSYATFFMNVLKTADARRGMIRFQNSAQRSNDGMFLESLLSSCVCLSSHSNGFSGVMLQQFLSDLVYQIQRTYEAPINIMKFEGLDFMKDFLVPFLSPPNQKWPDWLSTSPDYRFSNLTRTLNKDQIDLSSDCGITGESKDYGDKIKLPKMKEILLRIPEHSKLHIVFVRQLQGSYFTKKGDTFQRFSQTLEARNRVYFKISASDNPPSLENIEGLPFTLNEPTGAVIFVLVPEDIKYT